MMMKMYSSSWSFRSWKNYKQIRMRSLLCWLCLWRVTKSSTPMSLTNSYFLKIKVRTQCIDMTNRKTKKNLYTNLRPTNCEWNATKRINSRTSPAHRWACSKLSTKIICTWRNPKKWRLKEAKWANSIFSIRLSTKSPKMRPRFLHF